MMCIASYNMRRNGIHSKREGCNAFASNNIMKKIFLTILIFLSIGLIFSACSGNKTEKLAAGETYTCEMHNEVMSDHPGDCPKCGMKLVKQKMTAAQEKMMK